MFQPVRIAPSILSADFMNLARDIRVCEEAGADFVHFDVMDGHFVPNLTIGVPLLKQLPKVTNLPLDVHLMISNPLTQIPWFLEAGADIVTVHAEALADEDEMQMAINMIHDAGVRAALSVKPKTPISVIEEFIPQLDMVLIMSVEPGFSGQSYIEGTDKKVAEVVRIARKKFCDPLIQVDGGMGLRTAPLVAAEGADVLVTGNAFFKADDPIKALAEIAAAANAAREKVVVD